MFFLADVVWFVHFLWVLLLVTGLCCFQYSRWWKKIVIKALLLEGAAIILSGGSCPLTLLENWLRGEDHGSFIGRLLEIVGLSRTPENMNVAFVLLLFVILYLLFVSINDG